MNRPTPWTVPPLPRSPHSNLWKCAHRQQGCRGKATIEVCLGTLFSAPFAAARFRSDRADPRSDGAGFLACYAGPINAERTPILPPRMVCNASSALSDPCSLPAVRSRTSRSPSHKRSWTSSPTIYMMNCPRSGRVASFPSRGSHGSEGIF